MQTDSYPPSRFGATEIATRLRLHRAGRGWRGDCPICQYKQSLSLDVKDGKPLIWCANCNDRAGLAALLRGAAGGALPAPRPQRLPRLDRADPAACVARALAVWNGAEPITPECPAGKYLKLRRISHVANSAELRWRRDCPHPSGGRHLALLAAVSGPDGNLQGLQRVFLDRDGSKAALEPQKASLGVIAGGAVRLQDCSEELTIGEGIETAAAAGAILGLPAWAAVSAGNLAKSMMLPAEIRTVTIAADHDEPGIRAAETAWRRWRSEGRECRIVKPLELDADFNDLTCAKAQRGAR